MMELPRLVGDRASQAHFDSLQQAGMVEVCAN